MKTLLVNGSPRKNGCTFTALSEIAGVLEKNGIESEIFQIGNAPVYGCAACNACRTSRKCIVNDDCANELAEKMLIADAIVIGSPVYYAGPNGALCALLDRAFYSTGGGRYAHKPAAAVVSCRRGGSTAAFDRLNKYFTINNMLVVGSSYWNMVHGNTPEEVRQDLEGLQVMRRLGENMAFLMKTLEAGKTTIHPNNPEPSIATNFIR